jgi:hypothetical protein
MVMKRGRFSNYELKFVEDNAPHMTYLAIAKELDRDPAKVRELIEDKFGLEVNLAKGAQKAAPSLRSRSFWPLLKQQFSLAEQAYIELEWEKIYKQFGEDVTATEEMQIIDTIKLDVMMHRLLIKKEKERLEIDELKLEIQKLQLSKDDTKKPHIMMLKQELMLYVQAQQAGIKEYKDLQVEKNKILRDMKSTRDQRYERIEASSESIKAWMAELISNDTKREILGKHLEKVRLAMIDEEVRLAAWHKYEDGFVDQCLLTPQTVKDGHSTT